jgi:hypothetical protein
LWAELDLDGFVQKTGFAQKTDLPKGHPKGAPKSLENSDEGDVGVLRDQAPPLAAQSLVP